MYDNTTTVSYTWVPSHAHGPKVYIRMDLIQAIEAVSVKLTNGDVYSIDSQALFIQRIGSTSEEKK